MQEETFRTSLIPSTKNNPIDYDSTIVLLGSCFSENMGKKLNYFGFDCFTNPYGILFNPIAIKRAIIECIELKEYSENDLFFHNEQYHSYHHHSNFSNATAKKVLNEINSAIEQAHTSLKKASHVLITLGTASIYKIVANNTVVANCHKVPQKNFSKKLLSVTEVTNTLKEIIQAIHSFNNNAQIIFTVSPIRHLKDGIIENSRSKANLIVAVHDSLGTNCHYFPSYEIMNDDLRDYRFFESDMIHPTQTAVNYIWSHFKTEWISNNIDNLMKEVDTIRKGKLHRAFDPNSIRHKNFLKKLQEKEANLKGKHNIQL